MSIDYFKKTNGRLFGSNDRESKKKYITSFGVILFPIQDNEILYQMCKPRDSVTYVSFMRGLYTKIKSNKAQKTPESSSLVYKFILSRNNVMQTT